MTGGAQAHHARGVTPATQLTGAASTRPRQIITVPGVAHGNQPFPLAVRIGPLVVSSAIPGKDPETGTVPADPRRQVELLFENVREVMSRAGGSVRDIAQVLVSVSAKEYRELVNEQWVLTFPDADDRPARNTQVRDLGGGMICCAIITAFLTNP